MLLATAGHAVLAGDFLDWYRTKIGTLYELVTPTLLLVAAFFAVLAWVMYRSWKKAVVTLIGGAIVIAIVHQILNLAGKAESELSKAPDHPGVVQLHHGGHVGRVRT